MMHLAGHRAEAAHLPHQPFQHRHLTAQIGGPELAGLLAEIDQNRAGLEYADRRAARALGVDDRRDLAVRTDFDEGGGELLTFADVHGLDGVGQAHLLQSNADLAAVRCIPGVEFNCHRDPPFLLSDARTHERTRITVIARRFKVRSATREVSGPDAIEIDDVFLELVKPRHPLERGAMPLGHGSRTLHVAAVGDPDIVRIAFDLEWRSRTCDTQAA